MTADAAIAGSPARPGAALPAAGALAGPRTRSALEPAEALA